MGIETLVCSGCLEEEKVSSGTLPWEWIKVTYLDKSMCTRQLHACGVCSRAYTVPEIIDLKENQ